MKKRLIPFGLFLLLSATFQAQAQSDIKVTVGETDVKSVSKARSIGYSNTLSPVALGMGLINFVDNTTVQKIGAGFTVYGIVMGPSTANFHAEDYKRGMLGMAVRGLGAYLMVDATREIFGDDFGDALGVDNKKVSLTDTRILIGEVLVVGSMVYNILSARASVNEFNTSSAISVRFDSERIHDKITPMLTAIFRL